MLKLRKASAHLNFNGPKQSKLKDELYLQTVLI